MDQVQRLIQESLAGQKQATDQLFALLYDDLRKLAAAHLAQESHRSPLDATSLVNQAFLRLQGLLSVSDEKHLFVLVSETMRRILVDRARARQTLKRGGVYQRQHLDEAEITSSYSDQELLEAHLLLDDFAQIDPTGAELAKLHIFCGFSIEEAAKLLNQSRAAAYRDWAFARAWLRQAVREQAAPKS